LFPPEGGLEPFSRTTRKPERQTSSAANNS
jgi:hypothetical protein